MNATNDNNGRFAPTSIKGLIATMGPAWVTAATVIGGGELMTVPKLGAQAGIYLLWVIVLSCLVKVPMQFVFARHALMTGSGTMEILASNRFRKWILGYWIFMQLFTLVQLSGTLQGTAQVINTAIPSVSPLLIAIGIAIFTIALLIRGSYKAVDYGSIVMVISFTIVTMGCAVMLQLMPAWRLGLAELFTGLIPGLPPKQSEHSIVTALAVFGMTGMAATDVIAYPYWLKSDGWIEAIGNGSERGLRLNSWIRVLKMNILSGCLIYTLPTVALYLLGAVVLHRSGLDPDDNQMIQTLSKMYVPVLGSFTWAFFFIGSFSVLYSTFLGASGGHALVQADFLRVVKIAERDDGYKRWSKRFYLTIPIFTLVVMVFFKMPVTLMLIGGAIQTGMLPLLAGVAIWIHYQTRGQYALPSSRVGQLFHKALPPLLWVSGFIMLIVASWTAWIKFS